MCSGVYANNMTFMYMSAFGHIIGCSEFIRGIYTGIVVSCAHEVICICCIYVTFGGIFVSGIYVVLGYWGGLWMET